MIDALLLCAFLPLSVSAEPAPAAREADVRVAEALLRRTLAAPRGAWSGELVVEVKGAARARVRELFSAPDLRRREVLSEDGSVTLLIVSDGRVEWTWVPARALAARGIPADPDVKLMDPDEELDLLLRSQALELGGTERVAGREARVLILRRRLDGKLSLRLWVDEREGLVLRREAFGEDGERSSLLSFESIVFSSAVAPAAFAFSPPKGARVRERRWRADFMDPEEAAAATGVSPVLPRVLPAGFVLESVNVLPYKGASILHSRFTDGVSLLSLFQYPREARLRLGWGKLGRPRSVRVGPLRGRVVSTGEGKILDWKGPRSHFVLIGPGSIEGLRRVAESVEEGP